MLLIERVFPGWEDLEGRKTERRLKLGANGAKSSETVTAENKEKSLRRMQRMFLEDCSLDDVGTP